MSIREAETGKWSSYDQYITEPILNQLGTDKENFTSSLDRYYNHSSPQFVKWEGNGETVLVSAFSFLTTNFALSVALFVIFRILFNIFFRFRISLLFRPQSFWGYLVFFVMEGNLQVLLFYSCSVLRLNFYYNPKGKLEAAFIYLFLYFLVLFSVAGYFLAFMQLGKLFKYFADNVEVKPSFTTAVFLTIEYGIKNLLLAMVHSLLRAQDLYKVQFIALGLI